MKAIPFYIKNIKLKNIETFVNSTELNLTKPDGTISQWTLILGDNGIGKSNLLRFIAWMKPQLPYDASDTDGLDPAPMINDEENEVLERLVHRSVVKAQTATVDALFVANHQLNKKSTSSVSKCETKIIIELNDLGKLEDVSTELKAYENGVFYTEEVMIFAYGASRQLGKLNLNNPKLLDTIPNFIQEKTELYDVEEILHTLHYASLGSKDKIERKKYKSFIKRVKQMLVALLPDFEHIKDIEINPPKILNHNSEGGFVINTKHGQKIPFGDFSLGYKTVTAWTVDLAWRLFNKHHIESENPLEEPAIVLIDEIDLHLHPRWQKDIMANLSKHFPNIQFIATAHSPLMVQAAVRSNHAVLKFEEGSVRIENEPEGIDGWRVDQILTSDFFGLKSSRGKVYEELVAQREHLLAKKKLAEKDEAVLKAINSKLSKLPTGETPEEIDNRKELSKLVQKLKNKSID